MSKANVEIFRTNIASKRRAHFIVERLSEAFPTLKFNVDLHDCEKILRVEGELYKKDDIRGIAESLGIVCVEVD